MRDGLTLYSKEELSTYLTMIHRIKMDYKYYCEVASKYQAETWGNTPWYKKLFIMIKGIDIMFMPKEYNNLFKDKMQELSSHYKGTRLLNKIARTTYTEYGINTSVASIVEFADSGKDCYLDAGCVEVINLLKNNYHKLDEEK